MGHPANKKRDIIKTQFGFYGTFLLLILFSFHGISLHAQHSYSFEIENTVIMSTFV